ncbi:hypothetical protein LCGC14_2701100 [marine sediment metagenome]|uniref:Uncharacterized protein n=1 Tax=marine sediment metagenome TaxID=412755 RepID=A0A0F9C7K7_9ZZZZ
MAIADKKKVQTMVNISAEEILKIRKALERIKQVRAAFQTHNPVVTGTALENRVAALNASLNALDIQANLAVWNDIVGGVVPSHRNKALGDF